MFSLQDALALATHDLQPEQYTRGSSRRSATGSSSLSGAMGDIQMSTHSPPSNSSSPSGMAWTPSPTSAMPDGYSTLSSDATALNAYLGSPPTPVTSGASQSSYGSYHSYGASGYAGSSPESPHQVPSGVASAASYTELYGPGRQPHGVVPLPVSPGSSSPVSISRSSRSSPERLEAEIHHLRNKIRELELINKSARERVRVLEHEVARVNYTGTSTSISGLPSPMPTPIPPTSLGFQENWQARTNARIKMFCSLNRAGNALCAWHDSRRERRQFPPRNAPPGYLNCGCTYEEALFEESLSRHGVGSYHPGENVRMDPALRNPLLKLLQERYGYQDGDFERDSVTGNWQPSEGAAYWEARAASGSATVRRQNRSDNSS